MIPHYIDAITEFALSPEEKLQLAAYSEQVITKALGRVKSKPELMDKKSYFKKTCLLIDTYDESDNAHSPLFGKKGTPRQAYSGRQPFSKDGQGKREATGNADRTRPFNELHTKYQQQREQTSSECPLLAADKVARAIEKYPHMKGMKNPFSAAAERRARELVEQGVDIAQYMADNAFSMEQGITPNVAYPDHFEECKRKNREWLQQKYGGETTPQPQKDPEPFFDDIQTVQPSHKASADRAFTEADENTTLTPDMDVDTVYEEDINTNLLFEDTQ